jgi:hypothetical protein
MSKSSKVRNFKIVVYYSQGSAQPFFSESYKTILSNLYRKALFSTLKNTHKKSTLSTYARSLFFLLFLKKFSIQFEDQFYSFYFYFIPLAFSKNHKIIKTTF